MVQELIKLSQDVVDVTSVNQFKNRLDKFWQRYGPIIRQVQLQVDFDWHGASRGPSAVAELLVTIVSRGCPSCSITPATAVVLSIEYIYWTTRSKP